MDAPPEDPQTWWDRRYRESEHIWTGDVNAQIAAELEGTRPRAGTAATALDVGCGEGGDALWLAGEGWQVTGIDVSGVALERAERRARQLGLSHRTQWERVDLTTWTPHASYDLVTTSFLHSFDMPWKRLLAHVPASVAPGGTLLMLGHHPEDVAARFENTEGLAWHPDELVVGLGLDDLWRVEVSEVRERTGHHAGANGHHRDVVFRARRLPQR